MPRRDPTILLEDVIEHSRRAIALAKGRKAEDLDEDEMVGLALVRLLEVTGEAASQLPPELRARHSDIPWRDLIDLRNVLIHAYHRIDYRIVWEIVTEQLPSLVVAVEAALARERKE